MAHSVRPLQILKTTLNYRVEFQSLDLVSHRLRILFSAPKYDGSKAFIRNDKSYLTDIEDEANYWRDKFSRRKRNLQNGFFSDKAKPYQTMGKVYLESGDLILSSLTDELKCKVCTPNSQSFIIPNKALFEIGFEEIIYCNIQYSPKLF